MYILYAIELNCKHISLVLIIKITENSANHNDLLFFVII